MRSVMRFGFAAILVSVATAGADAPLSVSGGTPVADYSRWTLGEPDLVVATSWVTVKADAPDFTGGLPPVSTGLGEDRLVKSVEIREESDGAGFVFRQMLWTTAVPGRESSATDAGERSGTWPVFQVGRNTYIFPDDAGKLLKAASNVIFATAHLHTNGRDTKSRLLFGFKFFPKGFKPEYKRARWTLGNRVASASI